MSLVNQFVVVDDDPTNNFLCKMVIERTFNNPKLITFLKASEAMKYLKDEYASNPVPTVLFLDINMPVFSGWDVLQIVEGFDQNLKNNLSIFMLSSSMDPADTNKAKTAPGIVAYLEKPLSQDKLKDVIGLMNLTME